MAHLQVTVSPNFTGTFSDSQATFSLNGTSSSEWRKEFSKTFRDSVIYNRKEVVDLLVGDSKFLNPIEGDTGPLPSQHPAVVLQIVNRLLIDCKEDIEIIKQVHGAEPDPVRKRSTELEDRPEYAMYRPLVRVVSSASVEPKC